MTSEKTPAFRLAFQQLPFAAHKEADDHRHLLADFHLVRRFRHPNLGKYFELLFGRDHDVFVVAEGSSETLFERLARPATGGVSSGSEDREAIFAVNLCRQVVDALCFLNSHGTVHGHLDSQVVLLLRGDAVKLTGHGLTVLYRGKEPSPEECQELFRPLGQYMAPEHAFFGARRRFWDCFDSCKPDVWAIGIMMLEVLQRPWQPTAVAYEEAFMKKEDACFATAVALQRFAAKVDELNRLENSKEVGAGDWAGRAGVHAVALFSSAEEAPIELEQDFEIPLPIEAKPNGELFKLEQSWREWLSGSKAGRKTSAELQSLWEVCLTPHSAARPSPSDLATHPAMGPSESRGGWMEERLATGGQPPDPQYSNETQGGSQPSRPRRLAKDSWTNGIWMAGPPSRLDELYLLPTPGGGMDDEVRNFDPQVRLNRLGVRTDDIFYWWTLAGGDVFKELVKAGALNPLPPVLRLPQLVRLHSGENGEADPETIPFLAAGEANFSNEGTPVKRTRSLRKHPIRVGLVPLVEAVRQTLRSLDTQKEADETTMNWRLEEREANFEYQWKRVRLFRRLLQAVTATSGREELFKEAAIDIPPLVRAEAWFTLLGSDPAADEASWGLFYRQLQATPSPQALGELKTLALLDPPHFDLWNDVNGSEKAGNPCQLRLERLVTSLLKANPSLSHVEDLGCLAAVFEKIARSDLCTSLGAGSSGSSLASGATFCFERETATFLALQRLLHGLHWTYYAGAEAKRTRFRALQLFGSLFSFVDPALAAHLNVVGMTPEMYASDWLSTWFARFFPFEQLCRLWDALLLRPPHFSLFVAVCLLHAVREPLLQTDDFSVAVGLFSGRCLEGIDIAFLVEAATGLFQAVPASVTLPLFPRHSAGEALLCSPGTVASEPLDESWSCDLLSSSRGDEGDNPMLAAKVQLAERTQELLLRCGEWWNYFDSSPLVAPWLSVDDLLSFRSCCTVLDVRSFEEFSRCHFQGSIHLRDPMTMDLAPPQTSQQHQQQHSGASRSKDLPPPSQQQSSLESATALPLELYDAPWLRLGLEPTNASGSPSQSRQDLDRGRKTGQNNRDEQAGGPLDADDMLPGFPDRPWLFGQLGEFRLRLVVVIGDAETPAAAADFAARLLAQGILHVLCLAGGVEALKADAPSYMGGRGGGYPD